MRETIESDLTLLIRRVKTGDTQAFLELIAPHLPTLRQVSHCMLRNRADAEDAVQETALKACLTWTSSVKTRA